MALRLAPLALLVGVLVAPCAPMPAVSAQERSADAPREDGGLSRKERIERNRERWSSLSEEQRREIRRRHQAFRRLDPEKRRALIERLRAAGPDRAENLLRHHHRFLERDDRDELRRRHRVLEQWRSGLSPEERDRLGALSREEFRQEMRARFERKLEEHRATLSDDERAAFDALDRRGKYRALRRAHEERRLAEHRAGLSPEARAEFDALSPEEQRRVIRPTRPPRGGPGERERGPGDRERGPGDRERGPRGEGRDPAPGLDPELRAARQALRELSPRAVRTYLRDGTLPARDALDDEARRALESLDPEQRGTLRASFERRGRPGAGIEGAGTEGADGPRDGRGRPRSGAPAEPRPGPPPGGRGDRPPPLL